MSRALSFAAIALGTFTFVVWVVAAIEIRVLRPTNCSIDRMQFEGWLLLARAASTVTPAIGLLATALAFGAPRRVRGAALTVNLAALAWVALMFAGLVPIGHLPCLRD